MSPREQRLPRNEAIHVGFLSFGFMHNPSGNTLLHVIQRLNQANGAVATGVDPLGKRPPAQTSWGSGSGSAAPLYRVRCMQRFVDYC